MCYEMYTKSDMNDLICLFLLVFRFYVFNIVAHRKGGFSVGN